MAGPSSELADGHARQDLRRGGRAWPRGARDADRGRTGGGQALAGPAPLRAHRMTGSTMPHPTIYTDHLITADELAAMPEHARFELVLGRLVPVAPASTDHGDIGSNLTYLVMHHVRTHKLGRTYIAETGFDITRPGDPGQTVLGADLAFIQTDRVPARRGKPAFRKGGPDMVYEIAS